MRKIGIVSAPAFVLALALSATAQDTAGKTVTTLKERTETVKVSVSGNAVVDFIFTGREMADFIQGPQEDQTTFEGEVGIRLNIELSQKVSVLVEIGRERVDGTRLPFQGDSQNSGQEIVLREFMVTLAEFLTPEMKAHLGIPTWSFDVRGKGSSFAFDPRHSEALSLNPNRADAEDGIGSLAARAAGADELDPMGAWFRYSRENITFDLLVLPMVVEGGDASTDEALYAADFWYTGEEFRLGAILAIQPLNGNESTMFTLGFGIDLTLMNKMLELFGELYFQFGEVGVDLTGDNVDAGGIAFQAGAQLNFQAEIKPWIALVINYISGDDDATDDEAGNFLAYENVHDLMIIEDQLYGFDWDSNILAIKISGGFALSLGQVKNNLELWAIVGICKTAEDVQIAGSGEDALGNELDLRARFHVTSQVSFTAALAFLFGSDIMEESGGVNGEDSSSLFSIGTDVRF